MFRDAYARLEEKEAAALLQDVNPRLEGSAFDPARTTVLRAQPPFYPGWEFYDIADHSAVPVKRRSVFYRAGEEPVVLDGTNEPLYALNKKAPLSLSTENVADYVRFFFAHVAGRHGRFVVTEGIDDIIWREEPPPAARKATAQILKPLHLAGHDKEGGFTLQGQMMFRDSLFRADIGVSADGLITLSNEELLIEDIPVIDEMLGQ